MCWSCHWKFDSSQTNDYVMISLLPIRIKCPIFLFLTSLLQTAIRFHQRRSSIGNKRRPRSFATKTFTGKWTAALKWSGTSADCSQMKQDSKVTTERKKQSFQHFKIPLVLSHFYYLSVNFLWILNLRSLGNFSRPPKLTSAFPWQMMKRSWRNHTLWGHERPAKLRVVSK